MESPTKIAVAGATGRVGRTRAERLVEMAKLFTARHDGSLRVEEASDPADPDSELFATGPAAGSARHARRPDVRGVA